MGWMLGLRLFALSKGLVGFIFGSMLVPLQAGVAFAKSTTGKTEAVRGLRKAPSKKKDAPDSYLTAAGFVLAAGSDPGREECLHIEPIQNSLLAEFRSSLVDYAHTLLGRPYRSGGKKPASGFDCSGFTGYVFRQFGIGLPSCSRSQSQAGVQVKEAIAQAGDLVFFGRKQRKGPAQIYHTGIVASNQDGRLRVIHSATGEGVVVTDMSRAGYWRNHLVAIRRVIDRPVALVAAQ